MVDDSRVMHGFEKFKGLSALALLCSHPSSVLILNTPIPIDDGFVFVSEVW
jgi:hypothetical protein